MQLSPQVELVANIIHVSMLAHSTETVANMKYFVDSKEEQPVAPPDHAYVSGTFGVVGRAVKF